MWALLALCLVQEGWAEHAVAPSGHDNMGCPGEGAETAGLTQIRMATVGQSRNRFEIHPEERNTEFSDSLVMRKEEWKWKGEIIVVLDPA